MAGLTGRALALPAAVGAAAQAYCLALIHSYQPQGYALDVYALLPVSYWVALGMVALAGTFLALEARQLARGAGMTLMLAAFTQAVLLPRSLGFFSYGRGDQLTHLGTVRAILRTGHVGTDVIYPAAHFEGAVLALVPGVSVGQAAFLVGLGGSFCLALGLVAVVRFFVGSGSSLAGLAVATSIPLYAGWLHFTMLPNFVFFALAPLLILALLRTTTRASPAWRIVLLVFVLAIPFGHPVVLVFCLFAILVVALANGLYTAGRRIDGQPILGYAALLVVTFMPWFMHSVGYQRRFAEILAAFRGGSTEAVVAEGIDKGAALNPTAGELFRLAVFYGGRYVIPMAVIGLWLLPRLRRRAWREREPGTGLMVAWFIALVFFQVALVGNRFFSQNPNRALNVNYVIFAILPLFVAALRSFLGAGNRQVRQMATAVLLTMMFMITTLGAIDSPLIVKPSQAVAHNEIAAAEWVFDNRRTDLIYDNLGGFGTRFGDYLLSRDERKASLAVPNRPRTPDHFGYDEDWIGTTGSKYIAVTSLGEDLYQTLYERVGRYTKEDFERLDQDVRLHRVYSTSDARFYYQAPDERVEI